METILNRAPCMSYSVRFRKDKGLDRLGKRIASRRPLGNLASIRKTDVDAPKIDGSPLEALRIVIAGFQIQDKLRKAGLPFLTLGSVEIRLAEKELVWRYTAAEAIPTTRYVRIIDKKEILAAALNENDETFMAHIAAIVKPNRPTKPLSYS